MVCRMKICSGAAFMLMLAHALNAQFLVLVESSLWNDNAEVKAKIQEYMDLTTAVTGKKMHVESFSKSATPNQLKQVLVNYYKDYSIEGALLVGDLAAPWIYFGPPNPGDAGVRKFPSEAYYMDMTEGEYTDWSWDDINQCFKSKSVPYETWRIDPLPVDYTPEIWVSRIVAHNLKNYNEKVTGSEANTLIRYFNKVIARIKGPDGNNPYPRIRRNGLIMHNVDLDIYNIQARWPNLLQNIYPAGRITWSVNEDSETMKNYLQDGYELVWAFAHGGSYGIYSDFPKMHPGPYTHFHILISCGLSDYTQYGSTLGGPEYDNEGNLFAMAGEGLITCGFVTSPNISGQLGTHMFITMIDRLVEDKSFGEAYKYQINRLAGSANHLEPWVVLLGAGTLKLRPYEALSFDKVVYATK